MKKIVINPLEIACYENAIRILSYKENDIYIFALAIKNKIVAQNTNLVEIENKRKELKMN